MSKRTVEEERQWTKDQLEHGHVTDNAISIAGGRTIDRIDNYALKASVNRQWSWSKFLHRWVIVRTI